MHRALVLALALGGCATYTHPLAQLPLRPGARMALAQRPAHSIAIMPFEDARGPEYTRTSPERFIPVVNLVHSRDRAFYPEQAGLLRTHEQHHRVIQSGLLGEALPSLLATEMGQMGLPDRVELDEAEPADYFVTGRIRRAELRHDRSFLLRLLGPLGVPFDFVAHDLVYDVALYDTRHPETPILSRTYAWSGSSKVGMYYGHEANLTLFTRSLEDTLPRVVTDIAAAIAQRG